eukprot:CAMPEP_0178922124 /NCGR_PEP_ID=MMETSP0786-20121207/15967_1 /TAXON_ID=186022 /ORGANISM="Thalassionema frauenfeldii, Strain CCMP 1798" /LENGTH=152 /DNA_ID=CAMNT_0020596429 /DNA_START=120 /DNA_END=578 /DNA_ORIENTATION=-
MTVLMHSQNDDLIAPSFHYNENEKVRYDDPWQCNDIGLNNYSSIESTTKCKLSDGSTLRLNNDAMNALGIHPAKKQMKKKRKVKTAAGAVGGVIIGTLIAGPIGLIFGAPIGGYAANKISKKCERRAQRKFEQRTFQRTAENSMTALHGAYA